MTVAPALPASTVVLLRPGAGGVEVLLVRRHDKIAFMGGAHVFPGGRVDPRDRLANAPDVCAGADAIVPRLTDVSPDDSLAFHVAAIRELFEEAGVFLAYDERGQMVAIAGDARARFDVYRREVAANAITMADVAHRERLRLACDALVYLAHWVTPEIETRRFDTRFFAAVAPEAQDAAHDNAELTHSMWVRPADAIDACRGGEIALPPPTWTTLRWLSTFDTVESAIAWARGKTVPRVQPGFIRHGDTRIVLLPGDPAVAPVEGFDAPETRFVLTDGRWKPVAPTSEF